ncbi:MAG: threonine-phosphate decarboxylase CobD [Elusimicrobiota bacterium]|nr:threonine-phosphate decarboxylase CobD [Elusimicrobiota bacterium]
MKTLHGGNITEAIKKYSTENILDFSANINPFGLPKSIKNIITNNIHSIIHYPDSECTDLKDTLKKYLKIGAENLLIGNGSAELIFLIAQALKPKKVLIPIPTFSEYETAVNLTGGKCIFLKTRENENFEIDITQIDKFLPNIDLIFICNPNNPTGLVFSQEKLLLLAKNCKKHNVILVIDEAFIDFLKNVEESTMIKIVKNCSNVLVLRSLTKFFAIPGLRVGYLVGNKKIIKRISKFQPTWSVNCFGQLVSNQIINDLNYIKQTRECILKEKEIFFKKLEMISGLKPYPPSANFILCKLIENRFNSKTLSDLLARKGILIRDCSNFRGLNNKFIRFAVRKHQENEILMDILRKLLNG